MLILLNFTEKETPAYIKADLSAAQYLFGNYDDFDGTIKPFQAAILQISFESRLQAANGARKAAQGGTRNFLQRGDADA